MTGTLLPNIIGRKDFILQRSISPLGASVSGKSLELDEMSAACIDEGRRKSHSGNDFRRTAKYAKNKTLDTSKSSKSRKESNNDSALPSIIETNNDSVFPPKSKNTKGSRSRADGRMHRRLSKSDSKLDYESENEIEFNPITSVSNSDRTVDYNFEKQEEANENHEGRCLKSDLDEMKNTDHVHAALSHASIKKKNEVDTKRYKSEVDANIESTFQTKNKKRGSRSRTEHENRRRKLQSLSSKRNTCPAENVSRNEKPPRQLRQGMSRSDSTINYSLEQDEDRNSRSKSSHDSSRSRRSSLSTSDHTQGRQSKSSSSRSRTTRDNTRLKTSKSKPCSTGDLRSKKQQNAETGFLRQNEPFGSSKDELNKMMKRSSCHSRKDILGRTSHSNIERYVGSHPIEPRARRRLSMSDINDYNCNDRTVTFDSGVAEVCSNDGNSTSRATRRQSMGDIYDPVPKTMDSSSCREYHNPRVMKKPTNPFDQAQSSTCDAENFSGFYGHYLEDRAGPRNNKRNHPRPQRRRSMGDLNQDDYNRYNNTVDSTIQKASSSIEKSSPGALTGASQGCTGGLDGRSSSKPVNSVNRRNLTCSFKADYTVNLQGRSIRRLCVNDNKTAANKESAEHEVDKPKQRRLPFLRSFAVDPRSRISPEALKLGEARRERQHRSAKAFDNVISRQQELLRKAPTPLDNFLAAKEELMAERNEVQRK